MPSSDGKRRHRRQKRITPRQARRALYIDFEGRKVEGEAPVLLGVLFDRAPEAEHPDWEIRQIVLDERCAGVNRQLGGQCREDSVRRALGWLLDLSDLERRHVVSWSRHDREVLEQFANKRAFRYRNAIPTAKRWRARQAEAGTLEEVDGPNEIERYERLIGYERPREDFGVGESIRYIRELAGVTPGALRRWGCLLGHNFHDLQAMQHIVWYSVGLLPFPPPTLNPPAS